MKTYFNNKWFLTAALAGTMLFNGCTKLDEEVYSEVLAQNFQATANDVPALIAPVYTVLRANTASWQALFDLQEEAAEQQCRKPARTCRLAQPILSLFFGTYFWETISIQIERRRVLRPFPSLRCIVQKLRSLQPETLQASACVWTSAWPIPPRPLLRFCLRTVTLP